MSDSEPDPNPKRRTKQSVVGMRIDTEHLAALDQLARRERMTRQDMIRHLIRITHSEAFGKDSPFLTVESILRRKVG